MIGMCRRANTYIARENQMADRQEIERHYDSFGPFHLLRLEDAHAGYPDYTCAFYDGDFSLSLVQAQQAKHAWIFDGLGLGQDLAGKRILDIGCGWGPMLHATRRRGGDAVGLTLSSGQAEHCQARGLQCLLMDYKRLKRNDLGLFDGIVSLGAFEHFCSVADMQNGDQERVYRDFFRICAEHLRPGGRLFLQTMVWGGQVPDYNKLSLDAPPDSMEAILARMEYFFPGSWLPNGLEHIVSCAEQDFEFVASNNGRLDYLQTTKEWEMATRNLLKPHILPRALWHAIPLALRILTDRNTRIQWQSISRSDNTECFRREIMSHERIFFVKKS
jgi:cyclopropane-fatty-acyl-phospholipid synthase